MAAPTYFQDAFYADASINKMRADILKMEKDNMDLDDEIQCLRYNLNRVAGEHKVEGFHNEIIRKDE
jgi:hypothetical protein